MSPCRDGEAADSKTKKGVRIGTGLAGGALGRGLPQVRGGSRRVECDEVSEVVVDK